MADDFQAVLNKQLPEHIRVMNVVRTTKNFVAKNKCEYRTYSYMLPAFAIKEHSEILKPLKAKIKTACSKDFTVWYEKQLAECENTKIFPTELEGHKEFRATEQDIKRFDDILKKYSAFRNVGPDKKFGHFDLFGGGKSILENRFFDRKFHSKNLKNGQISKPD